MRMRDRVPRRLQRGLDLLRHHFGGAGHGAHQDCEIQWHAVDSRDVRLDQFAHRN